MAKRLIKIFSHTDLDGFGGPCLLQAVAETMFPDTTFDVSNIKAGTIDERFATWLNNDPAADQFTDVYIMDMTPDSEYTFKLLNENFANHWLVFDHHESEAAARSKYAANSVTPADPSTLPSAASLVWDWLKKQPHFGDLPKERQDELAYVVELIRAYDTWDWQNDPNMADSERQDADNLDQLFWFYPKQHSAEFVAHLMELGWQKYSEQQSLLIRTLNERREHYIKSHLKDLLQTKVDGHQFGVVYASSYVSEIGHRILDSDPKIEGAMIIGPTSVSLRADGKVDVADLAAKYFNGGGHANAAGGRLTSNPIKVGEQSFIDDLQTAIKNAKKDADKPKEEESSVGDSIDPAMAAKLKGLFGNK